MHDFWEEVYIAEGYLIDKTLGEEVHGRDVRESATRYGAWTIERARGVRDVRGALLLFS